ncbi:MAG: protein DA1 [Oscillochloris sp.]|nr:protein DA1 [Oscillochloris sp.]
MALRRFGIDQCASCGGVLSSGYYTLLDRDERYCPACIATRPRCASCGAPLGDQHWSLHDGRRQCAVCHATAVYDPALARQIFDETVAGIVAQFELTLNVGVAFRMVDAPTLDAIRGDGGVPPPPGQHTLGLYQRRGHLRTIYMLYGLPRLIFRTTVAHEYAHAWQGERCPLLHSEGLREGFAEWVAYHHLQWLGCSRAAQRMLTMPHPYRPWLDQVLELERKLGQAGVIEYLKRAE